MDKPEGRYRHFKGGEYDVLMIASCSETQEDMVVYQSRQTGKVWVRPLSAWSELVQSPANQKIRIPRFEKV